MKIPYIHGLLKNDYPTKIDLSLLIIDYDREKHKEMLLDAAETVLVIFGFDRTLFGKAKDKKWWMELKRNAVCDIKAEVDTK